MKLRPIGVVAVAALAGSAVFLSACTAADADPDQHSGSDLIETAREAATLPRDESPVPEEGGWMKSEELELRLPVALAEVDEFLEYPDEESRQRVYRFAETAEFDHYGLFEDGMEYQFVLDHWACEWIRYARDSAFAGDTDGVIRAGTNLMQRIEFPG